MEEEYIKWDCSHLGSFKVDIITDTWEWEKTKYHRLEIPIKGKRFVVFCILKEARNKFPCIVEKIKPLFGLEQAKIHTLRLGGSLKIMYHVPFDTDRLLVWETPVRWLEKDSPLLSDDCFRREVRSNLAFCEILSLKATASVNIRIRNYGNKFVPFITNISGTSSESTDVKCSVMSAPLCAEWFEEESYIDTVCRMMDVNDDVKGVVDQGSEINISSVTTKLYWDIYEIIGEVDGRYAWFSKYIMDRVSSCLLERGV